MKAASRLTVLLVLAGALAVVLVGYAGVRNLAGGQSATTHDAGAPAQMIRPF